MSSGSSEIVLARGCRDQHCENGDDPTKHSGFFFDYLHKVVMHQLECAVFLCDRFKRIANGSMHKLRYNENAIIECLHSRSGSHGFWVSRPYEAKTHFGCCKSCEFFFLEINRLFPRLGRRDNKRGGTFWSEKVDDGMRSNRVW